MPACLDQTAGIIVQPLAELYPRHDHDPEEASHQSVVDIAAHRSRHGESTGEQFRRRVEDIQLNARASKPFDLLKAREIPVTGKCHSWFQPWLDAWSSHELYDQLLKSRFRDLP
ncbi:hypothetical protein MRB53_038175 [Persea americana]|nr:hypothetical protein MRB53_038175 [Persea americana]